MKINTKRINIQSEKDLFMNSFWKLTNNSMSRMSPSWKINTKRITTTSEREIYKLFLKTNQSFNVPHVPIMKINTTKINIQSEKDLFMNSFSKLINHSMSRMSLSSNNLSNYLFMHQKKIEFNIILITIWFSIEILVIKYIQKKLNEIINKQAFIIV